MRTTKDRTQPADRRHIATPGREPRIERGSARIPPWVVAAAVVVAMTACSQATGGAAEPVVLTAISAPGAASTGHGHTESQVPQQAGDACAGFTATALAVDTNTDTGPADARQRAVREYGTDALHGTFSGAGRAHEWDLLVAHRARVEVRVQDVADDPPPVAATRAAAGIRARRTAVGTPGWTRELPAIVTYCSVVRSGGVWRVDAVSMSDAGPGADEVDG